jgi:hypothetical protein
LRPARHASSSPSSTRHRYRRRRAGGPLTPALRTVVGAGKHLVNPVLDALAGTRATGVIEFATRRYMLDYGGYAEMDAGDGRRTGRSGEPPVAAPLEVTASYNVPPWLLDLARGITDVEDAGAEEIRGRMCRRLAGPRRPTPCRRRDVALARAPARRPYSDLERLSLSCGSRPMAMAAAALRRRGGRRHARPDRPRIEPPRDWSRLPDFGSALG